MPKVDIDKEKCKGCRLCVEMCPAICLNMSRQINSKGYFYAREKKYSRCLGCRVCAIVCPDVAITISVEGTSYKYFEY